VRRPYVLGHAVGAWGIAFHVSATSSVHSTCTWSAAVIQGEVNKARGTLGTTD
jgi:hypothetical protein